MAGGETFTVVFAGEDAPLDTKLSEALESGVQPYTGPDTVRPGPGDQVLPTGGRRVLRDITVEKINYVEVANTSGGTTILIGG